MPNQRELEALFPEHYIQDRRFPEHFLDIDLSEVEDAEQLVGLINQVSSARRGLPERQVGDFSVGISNDVRSPDQTEFDNIASDDTVSLYLREMSRIPLLSIEEEINLAMRIEAGRSTQISINQVHFRNQKLRDQLEYIVQEGVTARDYLIKANTRLVVSVARRYVGRGVPFLDLIQEGNLGLMKAVEKFDYKRGFRFSTYATWWIRQSVIRALADQGRTIRVPVHMADRIRRVFKISHELEQEYGRKPTPQEIAEKLGIDSERVRWMMQVSQSPISLESPVGNDEEAEFGMYVEDQASPSTAQVAYQNLLRERVDEVLSTLSPREARILRLRFGLGQDRIYTLEEIGRKFGLTRERIRQIEHKALRSLRQPYRARLLSEYR